ncbi:MAG: hypothetical protein FJX67_16740 [Alphaproteobacteria bacterium]|nr:hypothetical protein [Alphaproteobacteria bacterium]
MSGMAEPLNQALFNPLDVMEQIANAHDWLFDRPNNQEMAVEISGRWCDYRVYVTWHDELRALQFACAFDTRLPETERVRMNELLALINEKISIGHFDLSSGEGLPIYRHAIPMRGVPGASVEQVEDMVDIALAECDRFYPAFQLVAWGGRAPGEAMTAVMLEPVGEA